jgi:hypothetical protein
VNFAGSIFHRSAFLKKSDSRFQLRWNDVLIFQTFAAINWREFALPCETILFFMRGRPLWLPHGSASRKKPKNWIDICCGEHLEIEAETGATRRFSKYSGPKSSG